MYHSTSVQRASTGVVLAYRWHLQIVPKRNKPNALSHPRAPPLSLRDSACTTLVVLYCAHARIFVTAFVGS
jgi:hypothetical protein